MQVIDAPVVLQSTSTIETESPQKSEIIAKPEMSDQSSTTNDTIVVNSTNNLQPAEVVISPSTNEVVVPQSLTIENNTDTLLKTDSTSVQESSVIKPVIQEADIVQPVPQNIVVPVTTTIVVDETENIPDTLESVLPPDDENEVVAPADQITSA